MTTAARPGLPPQGIPWWPLSSPPNGARFDPDALAPLGADLSWFDRMVEDWVANLSVLHQAQSRASSDPDNPWNHTVAQERMVARAETHFAEWGLDPGALRADLQGSGFVSGREWLASRRRGDATAAAPKQTRRIGAWL